MSITCTLDTTANEDTLTVHNCCMKPEQHNATADKRPRMIQSTRALLAALMVGAAQAFGAEDGQATTALSVKESSVLASERATEDRGALLGRLRNAAETEKGERFVLLAHTASGKVLRVTEFTGKGECSANASPQELRQASDRYDAINAKDKIIGLERIHTHPQSAIMSMRNTKEQTPQTAPPSAMDIVMAIRNATVVGNADGLLSFNKEAVVDPVGVWETSVDGTHPFVQALNKKFEAPSPRDEKYPLPPGDEETARSPDPQTFIATLRREDGEQLYDLFQISWNIFYMDDPVLKKELTDDLLAKGKEIGITFAFTPHRKD